METWEIKTPSFGDAIRVKRALYAHHGIYIDENTVIAFGSKQEELNPDTAEVGIFTLQEFLKGGIVEVRNFTKEELAQKRSSNDVVNYAFLQLGRKGYNLINNNCEHFTNECLFGKSYSSQINQAKKILESFFKNKENIG